MPRLWSLLRGVEKRSASLDDWAEMFAFNGITYPVTGVSSAATSEQIEGSFTGYVNAAFKASGVIFACMVVRQLVFSEARFQWQQVRNGRPGDLFGTKELSLLETPWPNGSTGELLSRMEQDTSLAGNFFAARERDRLRRLRPDWTEIILTAAPADAVASDVAGYLYYPGGRGGGVEPKLYLPGEIVHWSPLPDPLAQYRGMSWLTPVVSEVQADKAATEHKLRFFRNAATPNLAVSFKESVTPAQFRKFMAEMKDAHQGVENAYKTMFLAGGADVSVIGADLKQLDFKATQGAGETRVAAAARVHPVLVGLSEGLSGSTLNAGNYNSAKRSFADAWARPMWRSASAALQSVLRPPEGARLWYDDRDIAFLREDRKDAAEIQQAEAFTIRQLVDAGYDAASVVAAVNAEDWSLLKHSGLFSVQLQPPSSGEPTPAPTSNGTQPVVQGDN